MKLLDQVRTVARVRHLAGDVIDLWATVKGLSLRAAALDLVETFHLETPGIEKRNG